MTRDHAAPGRRRAAPMRSRSPLSRLPALSGPAVAAATLTLGLVVGGVTGGYVGHTSREGQVAGLRSTATEARAAAADAQRVAEDQADRAAAAGDETYTATALAKHSAVGAERAIARTRAAERQTAACRAAMRTEMADVTVLLDILDRGDPTYTVERLKDVDPDPDGIRRCLGPGGSRDPGPSTLDDPPADVSAAALARSAWPAG